MTAKARRRKAIKKANERKKTDVRPEARILDQAHLHSVSLVADAPGGGYIEAEVVRYLNIGQDGQPRQGPDTVAEQVRKELYAEAYVESFDRLVHGDPAQEAVRPEAQPDGSSVQAARGVDSSTGDPSIDELFPSKPGAATDPRRQEWVRDVLAQRASSKN